MGIRQSGMKHVKSVSLHAVLPSHFKTFHLKYKLRPTRAKSGVFVPKNPECWGTVGRARGRGVFFPWCQKWNNERLKIHQGKSRHLRLMATSDNLWLLYLIFGVWSSWKSTRGLVLPRRMQCVPGGSTLTFVSAKRQWGQTLNRVEVKGGVEVNILRREQRSFRDLRRSIKRSERRSEQTTAKEGTNETLSIQFYCDCFWRRMHWIYV